MSDRTNNTDAPKSPILKLVTEACGDAPQLDQDPDIPNGVNDEAVTLKVSELEQEHRDLDGAILMLEERMPYDRLAMQRLKKRKLKLKDEIVILKGKVQPDIIA